MADLRIKICGITRPEQAVAIAQLRSHCSRQNADQPKRQVTALGFICVKKSPRYVKPDTIAQVTEALRQAKVSPDRIGVFAQANLEIIRASVEAGGLSGVQLHGDESLAVCESVRSQLPQVELIKAVRVRSPEDLAKARSFTAVVDALLLDAYHPEMLGGTGHTLDWEMLETFDPGCPWLLAGGLNPGNVAEALTRLSPAGIDLSSGVETSPGNKDIAAVQTLLNRISRA